MRADALGRYGALAFALLLAWDAYALGTRAQWANSLTCAIMAGMTISLWWRIR